MERTINRQAGVTLVELMISLLLGLLIAIGLATLFSQNKRSFYQNEDLARMMEDGRFALQELARDIGMAGFYAELASPAWQVDSNLDGAPNCRRADAVTANWANPGLRVGVQDDGVPVAATPFSVSWTYALFPRGLDGFSPEQGTLAVANNATAANATAEFPCLASVANLQADSDVVYTKRVAGAPSNTLDGDRVYVARRGPATGVLALGSTITASIPKTAGDPLENDWEFQPKVYYVRNIPTDINLDGTTDLDVPTLCRMVLNPGPVFEEDCIAQGIERFQIEWGVDSDGDGDANAYVSALDASLANAAVPDPNEVVSARIHVLARSIRPDPTYTNTKTYTFADLPAYTPDDAFYRRLFSTTVLVRNVQGMNSLAF
jgi:type IV pilus assembly protein PilW